MLINLACVALSIYSQEVIGSLMSMAVIYVKRLLALDSFLSPKGKKPSSVFVVIPRIETFTRHRNREGGGGELSCVPVSPL